MKYAFRRVSIGLSFVGIAALVGACATSAGPADPEAASATASSLEAASSATFGVGRFKTPGGRCLDVAGNGVRPGTALKVWSCHDPAAYLARAQRWTFKRLSDGAFRLQGQQNQCMTVTGTAVVMNPCEDAVVPGPSDHQRWTLDDAGRLVSNGQCLHMESDAVGAGVVVAACNGSASQTWAKELFRQAPAARATKCAADDLAKRSPSGSSDYVCDGAWQYSQHKYRDPVCLHMVTDARCGWLECHNVANRCANPAFGTTHVSVSGMAGPYRDTNQNANHCAAAYADARDSTEYTGLAQCGCTHSREPLGPGSHTAYQTYAYAELCGDVSNTGVSAEICGVHQECTPNTCSDGLEPNPASCGIDSGFEATPAVSTPGLSRNELVALDERANPGAADALCLTCDELPFTTPADAQQKLACLARSQAGHKGSLAAGARSLELREAADIQTIFAVRGDDLSSADQVQALAAYRDYPSEVTGLCASRAPWTRPATPPTCSDAVRLPLNGYLDMCELAAQGKLKLDALIAVANLCSDDNAQPPDMAKCESYSDSFREILTRIEELLEAADTSSAASLRAAALSAPPVDLKAAIARVVAQLARQGRTEAQICAIAERARADHTCPASTREAYGRAVQGRVATGQAHTCVILSGGRVTCFGEGRSGELGNGATARSATPVMVPLDRVTSIAAGLEFTCAVRAPGDLYCWGSNTVGQTTGTEPMYTLPTRVAGITDAVNVTAGQNHACASRKNGEVVCWGLNDGGQLGVAGIASSNVPVTVTGPGGAGYLANIDRLTSGYAHTCGLTRDGDTYCWGDDQVGQLGDGTAPRVLPAAAIPARVAGLPRMVSLGSGWYHTCAIAVDGTLWCWGNNPIGQIDPESPVRHITSPIALPFHDVRAVSGGHGHTCFTLGSGALYCQGWNRFAQLGRGTMSDVAEPTQLVAIPEPVREPFGSRESTCAQAASGNLYCWGVNKQGQLGPSGSGSVLTPYLVPLPH
jgi:alpha-tubulin suppressor-like RCC1 family protein